MTRPSQHACLVGLGLAIGMALAAGGSARADDDRLSNPNFGTAAGFKICEDQTYALCAVASCFVFNAHHWTRERTQPTFRTLGKRACYPKPGHSASQSAPNFAIFQHPDSDV